MREIPIEEVGVLEDLFLDSQDLLYPFPLLLKVALDGELHDVSRHDVWGEEGQGDLDDVVVLGQQDEDGCAVFYSTDGEVDREFAYFFVFAVCWHFGGLGGFYHIHIVIISVLCRNLP